MSHGWCAVHSLPSLHERELVCVQGAFNSIGVAMQAGTEDFPPATPSGSHTAGEQTAADRDGGATASTSGRQLEEPLSGQVPAVSPVDEGPGREGGADVSRSLPSPAALPQPAPSETGQICLNTLAAASL